MTPTPKIVKLGYDEVLSAGLVGLMRWIDSGRKGRRMYDKRYKEVNGVGFERSIEGAVGECAIAKLLRVYWAGMGDFGGVDVRFGASQIEVKATLLPHGNLLVPIATAEVASDDSVVVLVRYRFYPELLHCECVGFLTMAEVKQHPIDNPQKNRPCYRAPWQELHDLDAILSGQVTDPIDIL